MGALVCAYLTWLHLSGTLALCLGSDGCETVQASRWAVIGPVPVALVGLVGIGGLLALALWRLRGAPDWTLTAIFTGSLAGTLYAAYLTYVELFVLGAVCPWCVVVALSVAAVLAASAFELSREPR